MFNNNSLPVWIILFFILTSIFFPSFTDGNPAKNTNIEFRWHNEIWNDAEVTKLNSSYIDGFIYDVQNENETFRQLELLKADISQLISETENGQNKNNATKWTRVLNRTLYLLNHKEVFLEGKTGDGSVIKKQLSCYACKIAAGLLQFYVRLGKSEDDVVNISYKVCLAFRIQSPKVCYGIASMFAPEVVYVLRRINDKPSEMCSFIMGDACGDYYSPSHEWNVLLPSVPKPAVVEPVVPKEISLNTLKVLQISDTHFDPYYQEGSNANCDQPLCCRPDSGTVRDSDDRAGYWGDYRKCDTPKRTVDHMLHHISTTHPDIDYIFWTGDLPPHDIWNQSRQNNLDILKETIAQMKTLFPKTPIFPALGNHESSPVDSFPPPFVNDNNSISWLYDDLSEYWKSWLPDSVSSTVRYGAFYSVLVKPGFRVISLNTNYCNNLNWWLLLNSTDPAEELQWFVSELQKAEFNGEKVHVIGHIPPGNVDCLKVWSRNYYSIVARYESTIVAQFFGHTHYDEFELFYDPENLKRPVSISYISPSVTPYVNLNPGYRIYYIDGDRENSTRLVLDHETWVMDLKQANTHNNVYWYKLYSAREAYQLETLLPCDWDNFIKKMISNDDQFNEYFRFYWKNSPVRPSCDIACKKNMLCDLRSGRSHDRKTLCQDIEQEIDKIHVWSVNALLGNILSSLKKS